MRRRRRKKQKTKKKQYIFTCVDDAGKRYKLHYTCMKLCSNSNECAMKIEIFNASQYKLLKYDLVFFLLSCHIHHICLVLFIHRTAFHAHLCLQRISTGKWFSVAFRFVLAICGIDKRQMESNRVFSPLSTQKAKEISNNEESLGSTLHFILYRLIYYNNSE